jgi:hypothetical protein
MGERFADTEKYVERAVKTGMLPNSEARQILLRIRIKLHGLSSNASFREAAEKFSKEYIRVVSNPIFYREH